MSGFGSSDQEPANWASAFAGGVSFWLKTFTMTCPVKGTWFEGNKPVNETPQDTLEVEYKDRRTYYCQYNIDSKTDKYYFYVQAKGE